MGSITYNGQKEVYRQMSSRRPDKQNVLHPYNGSSLGIDRKEVLTLTMRSTMVENIVVNQRSQSQKIIYHMIAFI